MTSQNTHVPSGVKSVKSENNLIWLDMEMTGLDPERDRVCEVAVVRGAFDRVDAEFQSLVRPTVKVSKGARKVHGLTDQILRRAPMFKRIAPELVKHLEGAVLVCHNVPFDVGFLHRRGGCFGEHADRDQHAGL